MAHNAMAFPCQVFHICGTQMTSPDELMRILKRYLKESNQSERVVASQIGVNHRTLHRWLTAGQSPMKGKLALAAGYLRRLGYLEDNRQKDDSE